MFKKLIRDKIPKLLQKEKVRAEIKTLSQEEYIQSLKAKLLEESMEALNAKDKSELCEELGDVMEVLFALYEAAGITSLEMDGARVKKTKLKVHLRKRYTANILS